MDDPKAKNRIRKAALANQRGSTVYDCAITRLQFFCWAPLIVLGITGSTAWAQNNKKADTKNASADATANYLTKVKPLLASRCFNCHGGLKQKSKLRLDTVAMMLKGNKSGPVIVPGKPGKSLLVERISTPDLDDRMPPQHEGAPFTAPERKIITDWIFAGAPAPKHEEPERDPKNHWSFKPISRPTLPKVKNAAWVRNPIDSFVAHQHEQHGLRPQAQASRIELVRRLYIDLIGLPPSPQEITAIENDKSVDWYEKTVERLLEDPRHGERWGRHWMDIWRYSDWWGLGKQLRMSQKHIWHWRDWMIESLNVDTPYDQMVKLMLAVDETHPNDLKKLRASGYLARNFNVFNRNQWMEDTVEHVGKGLLGLTMNCAKCHNHKFDPISQKDYYAFRAFFEPYLVRTDLVPGELNFDRNGIPRAFDALLDAPTYLLIRGNAATPDKSAVIAPGVPKIVAHKAIDIQAVSLPPEAWQPGRRAWLGEAHLAIAQKKVKTAEAAWLKAKEVLAVAQKNEAALAKRQQKKLATPKPKPAPPILKEDFATLDQTRWQTVGGQWVHKPGILEQKTNESARLLFLGKVPRNFEATMRFNIKGAGTHKSVGMRFDISQPDPEKLGKADNSSQMVYVSAGGNKVQAAWQRGGRWNYPAGGAIHKMPINVNQEYVLRVQVRGTLIKASLDGKPVISWRTPLKRREGAFELTTAYTSHVIFHECSIIALGPGDEPESIEAAKIAVLAAEEKQALAELEFALAKAELQSVKLRAEAMGASGKTTERKLTEAAIGAERQVALAKARKTLKAKEYSLVHATKNKKKALATEVKKARDAVTKAEAKTNAPITPKDSFALFVGAKWTPTRFLYSRNDDPKQTFKPKSTGRRTALANWITDRGNPLTARVAANHIWARHMGKALVSTTFDFGRHGAPPTHPELLNWLAVELMENRWSMKHLHRLIVTSATYRMGSSLAGAQDNLAKDKDNQHFWHRVPIRLESQVVRDSILSLAGELDLTMGGPSIPSKNQAASKRRSVYFFHSNNERNLFLTMFDEAMVGECYQRQQSVIPQQALALSNSALVLDAAPKIASRLAGNGKLDDAAFVRKAFLNLLGITANDAEVAASVGAMNHWRKLPNASAKTVRTHLVWALLNHNDFVTLR
jgi:hypothetical protein